MYSAAISHSLIVALMPRFRITGTSTSTDFLQEIEVLHVARADLDNVNFLREKGIQHSHVHQLRHDGQVVPRCGILEECEAIDALPLERIRTRARLERAAAHHPRTSCSDAVGRGGHLGFGLDRARSGDHLHGCAAQRNPADVDDSVRLVPFARDELVRLDDVHRAFDSGQRVEHLRIKLALVADRADERALGPARNVDFQAGGTDSGFDRGDLGIAGVGFHHDDHLSLLRFGNAQKIGRPFLGRPLCRLLLLDSLYVRARPSEVSR
jgi:hypothetical protein